MKILAIDGINGSGKTPCIDRVVTELTQEELNVQTVAPYHMVRKKLTLEDIYPLWESNPAEAVSLLHDTIDEATAQARDNKTDVLIFDRHWPTAFTQAYRVPNINELWGNNFVPTILFTSPPTHAQRIAQRGYTAAWLQAESLEQYRQRYQHIYAMHPEHFIGKFTVKSSLQDLQPIASHIIHLISSLTDV